MATLSPAPSSLHLASPALGPWFRHAADTPPTLPLPGGDLAVSVTLSLNMEWRAPAGGFRSYAFASPARPPLLATLRSESGGSAFTDGAFVTLFTLLPEVEQRLSSLTSALPSPDGAAAPAPATVTRPRVKTFALEIAASSADTIAKIEKLRPDDLDAALSADEKAAFLGLRGGASLANGTPVTELCRPDTDTAVILENRSGAPISAKLWCFDARGRALDPGAVASWWAFLATPAVFDNLWAHGDAADQRTATASAGLVVSLTNAHEGALSPALLARFSPADLTQVAGSTALYTTGAAPAIALTAAADPDTDTAPIARIAALPNGAYSALDGATPFAGWTGAAWPAALARDFLRMALVDIESHLVGLTRADAVQADPRRRITAARNTAAAPFLPTIDAVNAQVMSALSGGGATAMSPVMDTLWGASAPPASFGGGPIPTALTFTALPLAGEGAAGGGGLASGQTCLIRFAAGSLPPSVWVRMWTHGIDTVTGRRFRQDGGAGVADLTGEAFIVLPLPDGEQGGSLSMDAFVVADGANRYFADIRFPRPAVAAGARVSMGAIPAGTVLRNATTGQPFSAGAGAWRSGDILLAETAGAFALVDTTTLAVADMAAATLPASLAADDTLIVTMPAFGQTPEGTLIASPGPGGSAVVRRTRQGLTQLVTLGQPVPSQERREGAARGASGASVISAAPGREAFHEAPPPQFSHAGVPAGPEIHGPGLAVAGPAADPLRMLMIERQAVSLAQFIPLAGAPFTPTPDPGGTTAWTAVLETTTPGMVGDSAIRALLLAQGPTFSPGQDWVDLKTQIEAAVPLLDIDSLIDTASFDDDLAAAALDLLILKERDGAKSFATAVLAAIARAEDLIYIETPALDALSAQEGINLAGALAGRLAARPGLAVMLNVPERFLPNETAKLESIRKGAIGAALKLLEAASPGRVALFSPNAGPGRPLHCAATTVIVDDAVLFTGSAHLWRRGLTFDSALSAALFDENVTAGRPASVRAARLQLMGNALGLPPALVPEDGMSGVAALRQLNAVGGKSRVTPAAYPPADDPSTAADQSIWNPDGRGGLTTSWLTFFAALTGGAATEFNNAIR